MRYNKTKLEIDAVYSDQSSRFLSVYEQINSKRKATLEWRHVNVLFYCLEPSNSETLESPSSWFNRTDGDVARAGSISVT